MSLRWSQSVILLTGGTGSFGRKFTEAMLRKYRPKALRIFSRDELKQYEMQQQFQNDERLRFFIGDVRDGGRLHRAMEGADIVVHAAALKQVPLCESNPFEAVRTNVVGAENVVNAAIDVGVKKVMALSTDKAVSPANLYGATKLCAEKIFIDGNAYVGATRPTRMSCVRYGNVVGSRGSVVPLFYRQKATGALTITDARMTRFWITLEEGVEFVVRSIEKMQGGEIFVPKIPSTKIVDLARVIAPKVKLRFIGIRPGEKIHEVLLTEEEARHTFDAGDSYVIEPEQLWFSGRRSRRGKLLPEGFRYASNTNSRWLTSRELSTMLSRYLSASGISQSR